VARDNPLDYQRPLTGREGLIDRERELDSLQKAAADQMAIRLASPRRWPPPTARTARFTGP